MDQFRDYADNRLLNGCIYCGGSAYTRDHVPSRVFLDPPLPENLPIVWACVSCNNGFSQDEQYVACLIESVIAGSAEPDLIRRSNVGNILRRTPALRARLDQARFLKDGQVYFDVEADRLKKVLLKLARGHAAFELSQNCRQEPNSFWAGPLATMPKDRKDNFDACHIVETFGEVGSRGLQRTFVTQIARQTPTGETAYVGLLINDWVDVQDDRYRYLAIDDCHGIKVKVVIAEYLACEVVWAN